MRKGLLLLVLFLAASTQMWGQGQDDDMAGPIEPRGTVIDGIEYNLYLYETYMSDFVRQRE